VPGSIYSVFAPVAVNPKTVHLMKFVASCMRQREEPTVGAYGCGTSPRVADHGLHQPWRHSQDASRSRHRCRAGPDGRGEHPSTLPSSQYSRLLRHCPDALHAVALSRGSVLSIRWSAVASQPNGRGQCGSQVGLLSGPRADLVGSLCSSCRMSWLSPPRCRLRVDVWYRTWRLVIQMAAPSM